MFTPILFKAMLDVTLELKIIHMQSTSFSFTSVNDKHTIILSFSILIPLSVPIVLWIQRIWTVP